MTVKIKKQFGVWLDSHHATIVGKHNGDEHFVVLGHINNKGAEKNSNENAAHNQQQALAHKFFKETAALMVNAEEVHVTGTGQVQEQFIHFLASTPQYKHAAATHSTANKMSDDQLCAFMTKHFH